MKYSGGIVAVAFCVSIGIAHAKPGKKPNSAPKLIAPGVLEVRVGNKVSYIDPATKLPVDDATLVRLGKKEGFYNAQDLSERPTVSSPSWLLMDADTGQVLAEEDANTRRYPASTTKILTGLLLAEHTQPEDIITCLDPKVRDIEPSSLRVQPWEKFRADQLLTGFLLRSGNDAGVVIAQHVSKSVGNFAELMNARAAEIGCTNSNFVNPHGLHHPDHYTTAHDLALISAEAMRNERFAEAVRLPRRKISRSKNTKDVIVESKAKRSFYDRCLGADGIKTGFTNPAKHTYAGSATREGRRLLAVTLAAPTNASADALALINWGFARYDQKVLARKGEPSESVPVPNGKQPTVATVAGGDLHITFDTLGDGNIGNVTAEVVPRPDLNAPVEEGERVGSLVLKRDGKPLYSVPLIATESVEREPAIVTWSGKALTWGLVGGGILGVGAILGTATKNSRRRRNRQSAARGGDDYRRARLR